MSNYNKENNSNAGRYRVNRQIRAKEVRLIDEEGQQVGVVSIRDALTMAMEASEKHKQKLDLVEISPNASPPVAKILDYGKFKFEQSKKRSANKKSQKQLKIKEIKFRPGTDEGDYQVKLRNLRGFLESGHKVKVAVWFKGREMMHQELGQRILKRVSEDLATFGKVEFMPKLEGKNMIMIVAPLK